MNRRFGSRLATLRREIRECVVVPALAILLPWRLAFRLLRRLAGQGYAFTRETERALASARGDHAAADAAAWFRSHATMRIVDHVDPVLSFFRSDRYLERHVVVEGDALPPGPCVFVGFHYGTAFWMLRALRRRGYRASFLAARVTARQCPGEPLRLRFMRFRKRCVERASGASVIFVGGSRARIASALRSGISVVGLIDVPDIVEATPIRFMRHEVRWPDGLLRIAEAEAVPMVAFVAALDAAAGTRRIRFRRLPSDPEAALRALAAMLEDAIAHDASGWHLWGEWPRFVHDAAAAPGADGSAKIRVG